MKCGHQWPSAASQEQLPPSLWSPMRTGTCSSSKARLCCALPSAISIPSPVWRCVEQSRASQSLHSCLAPTLRLTPGTPSPQLPPPALCHSQVLQRAGKKMCSCLEGSPISSCFDIVTNSTTVPLWGVWLCCE